jgi:hypothetical protein
MAVELGSLTLTHLTHVAVRERARIVAHSVLGLDGDLAQVLGRPSVLVTLRGIFHGPAAAESLARLRALYLERQPVDFFADAVGEGYFAQVLIARLDLLQQAGELDQFTYACELVEYVQPPEPAALDVLPGLDADLLDEAASFMDDVQNALEEVGQLADLLANVPSFGDPTAPLTELPNTFLTLVGGGTLETLTQARDLI